MTRHWQNYQDWDQAEAAWDTQAEQKEKENPLKVLKSLPNMPGITADTAKNLKWKSLRWMIEKDENFNVLRHVLKSPFKYAARYIRSLLKPKPFLRDDDFFLYGIKSVDEFKKQLERKDVLLVVGFSYCEKPHECPSGRFTDACIHDPNHPVCGQCFIGKCVNALPETRTVPLFIPTIHYIAKKIFEIVEGNRDKQVLFLITACEMTLQMFGDWGNMSGIKGIGVRLDGRICNTMRAFELSETGIKPGLTVVVESTKVRMLDLLKHWRENGTQS
ncbi:MAG: hypothetical protein JSR37_00870 [Verrucomicrobia bacterium]|nr:hypothetical protein [Verrucomicrobiota bacterium]